MPRKPKPPMLDMQIEGLSGSAADAVPTFVDDFSGETVPMKAQESKPVKTLSQNARRKQRKAQAKAKLQAFAQSYVAQRDAAMELIKQRMQSTTRSPAKPGERSITLGTDLVIIVPPKPWRRL